MELELKVKLNLYLRDPEATDLGKKIIRQSVVMIAKIGFEEFTFKKLAEKLNTSEPSIYRYFENKHRLLIYIISWYWSILEYWVVYHISNLENSEKKIDAVIDLISCPLPDWIGGKDLDQESLFQIIISEGNKTYLTKNVTANNKAQLFKPYKDLCARIAGLIKEYNPKYAYAHSLSSTIIETAHLQYFFMNNLPSLTDFGDKKDLAHLNRFIQELAFSAIGKVK
jgi:AcrR family transcriptional regulator